MGFLPFARGSLMLDVVFSAMFLIVVLLAVSIYLVRVRRMYGLHALLQVGMAAVLVAAVIAFEIDVRFFTDWRALAAESPYFEGEFNLVYLSLYVHLCFAIPPVLWAIVITRAVANFGLAPRPGGHSKSHKFWGWVAAAGMFMIALTGWIFYYLAFVATR